MTAHDSPLPYMARRPTVNPILPVADMDAAIDFYRRLGFEVNPYDAGYAWVKHCGCEVWHLGTAEDLDVDANASAAYLHVDDADAWQIALAASTVVTEGCVVGDVADTPWGMREFSFRDPSGNLIRVGQNL